jgi:hypothetical protein
VKLWFFPSYCVIVWGNSNYVYIICIILFQDLRIQQLKESNRVMSHSQVRHVYNSMIPGARTQKERQNSKKFWPWTHTQPAGLGRNINIILFTFAILKMISCSVDG